MSLERELNVAIQVARGAGEIQTKGTDSVLDIARKDDTSPVTRIDRACEEYIRSHLLSEFPEDGFLGEESGEKTGTSGRRWIVDPLDGTRPYIRGIPTYSVLIGLEKQRDLLVGVMHFAAMNETYWASKGNGAFCNGQSIHVSGTTEANRIMGSALGMVERSDAPEGKALFAFMKTWDYAYGFMDAYSYAALASGKLDMTVNLLDKAWDCAAASCIVKEAGGRYSDLRGVETIHNGAIVLSNGLVHHHALAAFQEIIS